MKQAEHPIRKFWANANDELEIRGTLQAGGLDPRPINYMFVGLATELVKYRICISDEDYLALKLKFRLTEEAYI